MSRHPETTPDRSFEEKILTIPNAMSVVGGILTWEGSKQLETLQGVMAIVIGRTLDTLDGTVARATGQASEVGALVDAGIDKLVTAKLLWEMWRSGSAPKHVLATFALGNCINFAATGIAKLRGNNDLQVAPTGKLAMATEAVSLFAFAGAHAAEHANRPDAAQTLRALGRAAFFGALPLIAHSSWSYVTRAAASKTKSR